MILFSDLVTTSNTVFIYDKGESTDDYQHLEYVPIFLDEADPAELAEARAILGDNYQASIYDYVATGSADFARNTRTLEKTIDFINQNLSKYPFFIVQSSLFNWEPYKKLFIYRNIFVLSII